MLFLPCSELFDGEEADRKGRLKRHMDMDSDERDQAQAVVARASAALDRLTALHPKLIDLGLERTFSYSQAGQSAS